MKIIDFVLALVLALSCSTVGMTAEQDAHQHGTTASEESACCDSAMTSIEGAFKVVNSEELKALLESRTANFLLVDARTPKEFHKAHIKGAINIPVERLEKDVSLLTAPKHAKLVFYCNGIKCGKSKKSANIASRQGYQDVSAYVDGMPVWKEKAYPVISGVE